MKRITVLTIGLLILMSVLACSSVFERTGPLLSTIAQPVAIADQATPTEDIRLCRLYPTAESLPVHWRPVGDDDPCLVMKIDVLTIWEEECERDE